MTTPTDTTDYKDPKACASLKEAHDECFHRWMREKFIPGTATQDDCKPQWDAYQVCIEKKLEAFNLSHLLRKNGTQVPINTQTELVDDDSKIV